MANSVSTNDLLPLGPRESNMTDGDSDYDDLPSPDGECDELDEVAQGDGKIF